MLMMMPLCVFSICIFDMFFAYKTKNISKIHIENTHKGIIMSIYITVSYSKKLTKPLVDEILRYTGKLSESAAKEVFYKSILIGKRRFFGGIFLISKIL